MQDTIFHAFIDKVVAVLQESPDMLGLAVAGSWITQEMDAYSDLDLVLVSKTKLSNDPYQMKSVAQSFGNVLSAFTGEHVGEPRVLICLYGNPLLHVDIKFLTPDEFYQRVEDPLVVWERDEILTGIIQQTASAWPYPDYQWIEDRFWVWIHYATLKIGRGELTETADFLAFLRMVVLGPLLHIKNGNQPRGVRKVETKLPTADFEALSATIGSLNKQSLITALKKAIDIYEQTRSILFDSSVRLNLEAEIEVKKYLEEIDKQL